jgi:P27 family predicted phage terminase small subunit
LILPRTKKAAGTAVDKRNGRRTEIAAAAPMKRFGLPRRESRPWSPETRKAWNALWLDPVSSLLSVADRPILLRWADAIDRYWWAQQLADAEPEAEGSMGQTIENPLYGVADKAVRTAERCEAQIGIGALNRARLGLTFTQAQKSLQELNEALAGGNDSDDDYDPRR